MFPDYVKSVMDERERSIQELVRDRRVTRAYPTDARWRSGVRAAPKQSYGKRGL